MFRRRFTVTNQNSGIKPEEQLGIVAFLGVFLYVAIGKQVFDFIDKTKLFFNNLWVDIIELIIYLKHLAIELGLFFITLKGILIILAILLPFLLYFNYKWNNALSARLKEKRAQREKLELEEEYIKKLIRTNPNSLGLEALGKYINSVHAKIDFSTNKFREYRVELIAKVEKAEEIYKLKDYEDKIKGYKEQEKNYEELFEVYDEIKEKREREEEDKEKDKKKKLYRELYIDGSPVFYKEELSDDEVEVLKENKFVQVNEYDIFSQNVRPFLIKSPLNHSPTHTFLVWSMKKLLEDTKNVERIEEHLTKDADITFRYKKKVYALEIETGNLLSKKVQLKAKIAMLNRKYGKRWIFVVSNQEDLPAYRKWGKSTQRTEIEKVLEKWLE